MDEKRWITVLCVQAPGCERALREALATVAQPLGAQVQAGPAATWWVVFGAVQASERDALHAVEAALGLQQALAVCADAAGTSPLRCGIHGGLAGFTGTGADAGPRFLVVDGPVPAVAHELCRRADAGAVLVSEGTLGPLVYAFSTHDLGHWAGPDPPLRVRRVIGRQAAGSRLEAAHTRGAARFAGRAREMQALCEVLAKVRAGGTRFWAVCAPPGSGKTRLAAEFLRAARSLGCQVLHGNCEGGLQAMPLRPFSDMLRRHLQIGPGQPLPGLASLLSEVVGGIDPAAVAQVPALLALLGQGGVPAEADAGLGQAGQQALLALLRAWGSRAPLVVFIDDWQWADDASRELLRCLLATPGLRLLALVACRPTPVGDISLADAQMLQLAPLSDAEALQTIGELLPGGEPFVLQDVLRWSGGNPLFIEELCHHVVRHHGLPKSGTLGGTAWVENLIAKRLTALPPALRQVLDAAAVIGMVQPIAALAHLVGCSPWDPRLQALAEEDVLYPTEQGAAWCFKHELTRRVAEAAIDPRVKHALHHRMARWLNPTGDPCLDAQHCEALAYHWAAAGEHAQAARCGELAGARAMASSAIDLAKMQYRAVLDSLGHLPDTAERYQTWRSVARRYGLACVFDPGATEVPVFQRALQAALDHGDERGAAYAEYWTAYARYALGRHRWASQHGLACLRRARLADDRLLVLQAQALLAQNHAAMGQARQAQQLFDRTVPAIVQLRAAGASVGPGLSYVLACQAQMQGDLGRFDEAEQGFAQALEAAPGHTHEVNGSVLCLRACVRLWAGRPADALADAQEAERIGARVRSLYLYAMGRALAGRALWCLDGARAGVQAITEAHTWMQAHGQQLFVSLLHGWLAEAAAVAGDAGAVHQHVAMALMRARDGDSLGLTMALRARARLAAHSGQPHKAAGHLALADRVARRRQSPQALQANDALRRSLPGLRAVLRPRADAPVTLPGEMWP